MKYLVGWMDDNGKMQKAGASIVEAKSIYDAKTQFLQASWDMGVPRIPMNAAITIVRARCLEDSRFTIPLSTSAYRDPDIAYDELNATGVTP